MPVVELRSNPRSVRPAELAVFERNRPYVATLYNDGAVVIPRAGARVWVPRKLFLKWFRFPKYMEEQSDEAKRLYQRKKAKHK